MKSSIHIRKAGPADTGFIMDTVIMAEKGHGDKISYCALFGISEKELRKVLEKIFLEEISHFEFGLSSFMIAECNGETAGAYAAWIEGAGGLPSGVLKMSAFKAFLGKDNIKHYESCVHIAEEIGFPRKTGTIQFESLYIREAFRGMNIGKQLVEALHDSLLAENPGITTSQVQIIGENEASLKAHLKYGFSIVERKTTENPDIYTFFSGNSRLLMEKPLTKP